MSRLTVKQPEELTPEQREQYERISRFRRPRPNGEIGGPFDAWIRSPELAQRAVSLGNFLWQRTTLERRIVELAILVTARFWESNVEWSSHSRMAREHGLSQGVIDDVFAQERPRSAAEDELVTYDVCRTMHETRQLPVDTYERAVALFGEQGLMEMIATIGYYTFVAMTLHGFDVKLPDGVKPPFGH